MTIKILEGDCLKLMDNIEDKSVDMVLTDIPYGVINRKSNGLRNLDKGKADVPTFKLEPFLKEINRVTNGSIYIFCSTEQVSFIRKTLIKLGLSTRHLVWEKSNPSPMNGQYIWLSSIENCIYAKNKGATFNEHCKGSVIRFPNVRGKLHPTEKSLKLFEYLISVSSNPNDLILDTCAGSGTTGVACHNLNRNCILMEKEHEYIEMIEKRIGEIK